MTVTKEDSSPFGDLCTADTVYDCPTSIQHWQLRDLVHCPDTRDVLYCSYRHYTLRAAPDNKRAVVQDLAFEPTSLTVSHGYAAAGGQASQLDVRDLSSGDPVFKGACAGSVNNALSIARDASGELRLFVCNNDCSIKVLAMPTCAPVETVTCPVAVNYCALSPDAQQLLAVGDNRHAYIYAASPEGYRPAAVFTEAQDAGMSCSWSSSGAMFAVGSQDGRCTIWDHRSRRPVQAYQTSMAVRNVKFSPAPLDLLAFAEHRGRAHLVDARMWSRRQVLHAGACLDVDPDVSGLAFSPQGDRLYVGMDDGIASYSVNTHARRTFGWADLC